MRHSPSALRVRRGLHRGAERVLAGLRLVDARPIRVSSAVTSVPTVPFVPAAPPVTPEPEATDSVGAPLLTHEAVQEILDEMVRPALQSDGGDITLVKVDGGDVYVRLVGACSACPSSIMTMKLGVERLLEEELPGFSQLIEVDPQQRL